MRCEAVSLIGSLTMTSKTVASRNLYIIVVEFGGMKYHLSWNIFGSFLSLFLHLTLLNGNLEINHVRARIFLYHRPGPRPPVDCECSVEARGHGFRELGH